MKDDDYEYDPSDDTLNSDSEDDPDQDVPKPRRDSSKRPKANATEAPPVEVVNTNGLVSLEKAKTGRSKCRKCMKILAQGELRVGMQAWIMGRQAVTWQHPECFGNGIQVAVEETGRGKCKATSQGFSKGEVKLGLTSHTNTIWLKLSAVDAVLPPALLLTNFDYSKMKGMDSLTDAQRRAVKDTLKMATSGKVDTECEALPEKQEVPPVEEDTEVQLPQPDEGTKTMTKGRVAWRFGGSICYGSLLPKQETSTHCFARTHKGNTKTLAKGRDYWWLLASNAK